MKTFSQVLSYILPVMYLLVIYLYYTIFSGKTKSLLNKTTPILIGLLLIHAIELSTRHIALKTMPLSTAHDAFSFLAFSILFVYMIIEMSLNNRGSGIFILSFAFLLELLSSFNLTWVAETSELLKNPTFAIHASLSIMGYTALSLSAIYSLMYVIQKRNLKKHRLGLLFSQLPALTYLEKMSTRSVVIGIVLLGIGIILGHWQAHELLGTFWPKDIKVIVTDAVWILYFLSYVLARTFKWPGKWMACLSVFAFLILIFGGVLLMYVLQSFHKFN
ncbi:MAG TPA: hypothetical protein ENK44_09475 [Caldithrix abyssi]|uniref:Cytochrome c assembly protein domain-containing protein n=1 Tax=Caldithrix abyssi TaxID=187145 RepID=A0A7V4WVZ5_CALAY|nr:hypothetical protein [Caldithrix abyssi]